MDDVDRKIEEFTSKIYLARSGCWIWTGNTTGYNNGFRYGLFYFEGIHWLTHRFAYAAFNGKLPPKGYVLHHECETTLCSNPEHLIVMKGSEHRAMHRALRKPQVQEQSGLQIWADLVLNTWSKGYYNG